MTLSQHTGSPAGRDRRLIRGILFLTFAATALSIVVNVSDSTLLKPVALYILTALLVAIWLERAISQQVFQISLSPVHIAFLAYLLASFLSMTNTTNMPLSREYLIQLGCYFVIFSASTSFIDDQKGRNKAWTVFFIVTAVACVAGSLLPAIVEGNISLAFDQQPISTFGNATYFAGFLVIILPLVFSAVITFKNRRSQLLLVILALVMLYFLIRTESRSAWAAGLVSVAFFVILNFKSTRTRWIIFASLVIGAVLLAFLFPEIIQRRLSNILEGGPASSLARRLYFYAAAWKAFLASPVVGNGIGNFIVFLPRFRSPEYWMVRSEDIVPHAHNEFLEILSETGLLGFLCFAAMMVLYFRYVKRALKNESSDVNRTMLIGFASAIVAVLVDNLASMNLRTVPVALTFWMTVGMSTGFFDTNAQTFRFSISHHLKIFRFVPYLAFGIILIWYLPKVSDRYMAEKNFLEGNMLRWQDSTEESSMKFENVIAHDSSYGEAELYLASNLNGEKRYGDAREIIRHLLSNYPFYPKARILLAICSFELGDSSTATLEMNNELRIETSPQAVHYAAYFAFRMNRIDDEYNYLSILLNNSIRSGMPDYADEAVRRMGGLCNIRGNVPGCSQTILSLKQKFAGNSNMLEAIGDFYASTGLFIEARSTLAEALSLQPANAGIREKLRLIDESLKKTPGVLR